MLLLANEGYEDRSRLSFRGGDGKHERNWSQGVARKILMRYMEIHNHDDQRRWRVSVLRNTQKHPRQALEQPAQISESTALSKLLHQVTSKIPFQAKLFCYCVIWILKAL